MAAKISFTAYSVACGMAKLAAIPRWREYFPDEMLRLNARLVRLGRDTPLKYGMSLLPPRLYIGLMDAFFIPGMVHHFLFRKRFIESRLASALANGTRQVIVLGGGLDTLMLRAAKHYPDVRFFEIDLPNTQQAKKLALAAADYPIPPNGIFIAADLAQSTLEAALCSHHSFDPQLPTLVVIEGVLMYLTESEVRALFTAMHELFTSQLTVLFGATAASDDTGAVSVQIVNALLSRGQEATKWHCPSRAMPEFMTELGYKMKEWISYKALQRPYRAKAEIHNVPEEDENYYWVEKK